MGIYNILNLSKGTVLKSTHIKHIEDGLFNAHDELNTINAKTSNIEERLTKVEEDGIPGSDSSLGTDLSYTEI